MATLEQFARRMDQLSAHFDRRRLEVKRVVAARVLQGVVTATPKLSGRAAFNWNIGFNSPNYGYDGDGFYIPGEFDVFPRYGDHVSKMASSLIAISRASENDSIYISNATPYIGLLNAGYSKKAPAQFAQSAALTAAKSMANFRFLD